MLRIRERAASSLAARPPPKLWSGDAMLPTFLAFFGWGDLSLALGSALAATAVWTLLVLGWRGWRLRQRLRPFEGWYEIRRKTRNEVLGNAEIAVRRNVLTVRFFDFPSGLVEGSVVMNERFPSTGHGSYTHRFESDELAWGTWDVELQDDQTILVTGRYAHPREFYEVVQGYEWRRVT